MLDKDGNGLIEKEDFQLMQKEDFWHGTFKELFDVNKDGSVTPDEFSHKCVILFRRLSIAVYHSSNGPRRVLNDSSCTHVLICMPMCVRARVCPFHLCVSASMSAPVVGSMPWRFVDWR